MLTRRSDMGHLLPRVERFGIDSCRRVNFLRCGCDGLGFGQLGPGRHGVAASIARSHNAIRYAPRKLLGPLRDCLIGGAQ